MQSAAVLYNMWHLETRSSLYSLRFGLASLGQVTELIHVMKTILGLRTGDHFILSGGHTKLGPYMYVLQPIIYILKDVGTSLVK